MKDHLNEAGHSTLNMGSACVNRIPNNTESQVSFLQLVFLVPESRPSLLPYIDILL